MEMKIIYYLILLIMQVKISQGYLTVEQCANLNDEKNCNPTCPNQYCVNKRFGEKEKPCYIELIKSLPDDALERMMNHPAKQELIVRQYQTLLAYTDNRTSPSATGKNLLKANSQEYKDVTKVTFR